MQMISAIVLTGIAQVIVMVYMSKAILYCFRDKDNEMYDLESAHFYISPKSEW